MLSIFQDEDFIRIKISSEFKYVNNVIGNIRNFLSSYPIKEDSGIVLIVRELINNAIEHGNKHIREHSVMINIEHCGNSRFKISVEDEGSGFDYRSIRLMMPEDPSQVRNRGLSLINSFSDQVEFNEKGNCVTAYVAVKPETNFMTSEDSNNPDQWQIIRPTGDITAENGEKFRSTLLELFQKRYRRFRFDLAHVKDADSVALSIFAIFANMLREKFSNAELEIINANPDIITILRMTRLDSVYRIS